MPLVASRSGRLLLAGAVACFAGVFALFLVFERPGLGIGHGFYLAIVLAAMAGGPFVGAGAGALATALYAAGVYANPHLSSSDVPTGSTAIRLVTYVLVGTLIGYYAARSRTLLAQADELAQELRALARRDFMTGLPNQRAFEIAVNARLERDRPFLLVVCDAPAVDAAVDAGGRLLAFGERLLAGVGGEAEVARIGNDRFGVLAPVQETRPAELVVAAVERALADGGRLATAGWATFPRDGADALGLYTAASERLDARKIARGEWRSAALSA